jgi:hypothetical protein
LKKLSLANIAIAIFEIDPPEYTPRPLTNIYENAFPINKFKSFSVCDSHPNVNTGELVLLIGCSICKF